MDLPNDPGRCTRRILLAKIAATASAALLAACADHPRQPIAVATPAPSASPPLPVSTPHPEPDCAFGLWPSSTNLNPNGGFESSDIGYTVDGGTLAVSTEVARFGARAGKVVATATAVTVTASIAASAFAQTHYTSSVWIYAAPGVGGKSFFMVMAEAGGAAPPAEMGQRAAVVAAGWQRLSVTASLAQPDRSRVACSVTLADAAAGDTFYLDGWQCEPTLAPTPYLETDGAIAHRGAMQLSAPAATLDAVQGWVAARLRTEYAESAAPGTPQLLRWFDTPRKLLDVRYDKGLWKVRRITAAVEEEAGFPASRPSGSLLTIVAAWTAGGPLMSVDGGAFRAPVFRDDFRRADTVVGLGGAPDGEWSVTGSGAQRAHIADGRLVCDPGYSVYGYHPLPTNPCRLSGSFSLADAANGSAALIASRTPLLAATVFCAITRTASSLGMTGNGGEPIPLKTISHRRPLAADGTVYTVAVTFNPDNSLDFESPDGQAVHVGPDSRITSHLGNLACWYLGAGTGENNWQWESVGAECVTDSPATGIDSTPRIVAATYDIGSSRGTGDFLYGDLFWFASGTGTLTSGDAVTLAALGNSAPTMAQLRMLNRGGAQPTMVRPAAQEATDRPCQ